MAIKLRRPDPNEERLSWMKGIDCEICTDEGRIKGKLDFQYRILKPDQLDETISAEDQQKTYEFIQDVLVAVRGLKDPDNGDEWDPDDQLEFVLTAPELIMVAFRSYFEHTTTGQARKKA